jgi:hypothetical protein
MACREAGQSQGEKRRLLFPWDKLFVPGSVSENTEDDGSKNSDTDDHDGQLKCGITGSFAFFHGSTSFYNVVIPINTRPVN